MSARRLVSIFVGAVLLIAAIWFWRERAGDTSPSNPDGDDRVAQDGSNRRVLYWYDPMVPQHRFDKPGKSPFMDMQLVPKYAEEGDDAAVQIAPSVQQNLGIRLAKVERAAFNQPIVAVARLELNERQLHAVPSRVSGYVERLYVRAVGDPVSQGQKIAEIYSPELLSAQHEYVALLRVSNLSEGTTLADAARQRLRLLGMAPREIDALEQSKHPTSRFGVYSPIEGFVVELAAREGGQIDTGATLLTLAELSTLWLIAEVPERDTGRIQTGDSVEARLEGVVADTVTGKVDFIYPTLNEQTRTARVRIVVANPKNALRPGMFARVTIDAAARSALSVPSEAVIYTGERSLVIVKEEAGFRPAQVIAGAERGERTEIVSGLTEGEQVVSSGQFLIDSEASLNGVLARLSIAQEASETSEARGANDTEVLSAVGSVVSVDHGTGRATLSHGPIPELEWPAMTMPFRFRDPNVVHTLSVGETIRFDLSATPEDGDYIIERVRKESAR